MKKTLISIACVAALGLGVAIIPGCNSSWWQNFKNDPVAQVQTFEQTAQVAINSAQLAWTAIMPTLPPATAAVINTQFLNAVAAVNHAMQILNDGVNAAVAAQQANPDFAKMMQAVSDAIAQVIAIIEQYSGQPVAPVADAGAPVAVDGGALSAKAAIPGIEEMKAAYASLKHFGVK